MLLRQCRASVALVSFSISLFSAVCVAAKPAIDNNMETITVSATPIKLSDTASTVSIISREDLRRRSVLSLLREVPGLAISQQGSQGSIAQIRVRGAEANQVLVLINGIEVNDPASGSEFDFSQLSATDIERIEVVRGPQSALWGSDAMAGVIHIITRSDIEANQVTAQFEAGSFSTTRTAIGWQHATSRSQTKFSVDSLETDGTNISRSGNEEDGLENVTIGFTGGYEFTDSFHLDYTARHTDKTTEFDGTDFFITGLPVDADNRTDSEYLYAGITLQHEINESLDQALSFNRTDTDNTTKNDAPINAESRAVRDIVKYQLNFRHATQHVSIIAEQENETFEQRGAASFFGDPNQDIDTDSTSVAGEYRYQGERFNVSLSARADNNSDFDDASSWRATVNTVVGGATLYASIGKSTKNPTFTERFGFFTNFVGNPNLTPEESLQWEVGIRTAWLDNKLQLTANYFSADLENEINGFVFDATSGGFTAANIDGESQRDGVEIEAAYRSEANFDLKASYSYLDASQENVSGRDITEVRRPQHSAAFSVNYYWGDRADLSLAATYTGEQEDDFFPPFPPFVERVDLDSFTLVTLSARYRVSDHVTVTGRLENMTDNSYEQVFGFESPGIGGYLGVRFNW